MRTSQATCQNCDAPLATDAPGPICPACRLEEALHSADTVEGGVETALPDDLGTPRPLGSAPLEGSTLGVGGRYKILQRIGEGGFGTVYMAEQVVPVRRRVALKILKAGMDTRQLLARFEAERQALAMMDHPNIAKVFDGGETEHGRPFFVMELVRGTAITDFCNREKLPTKARLKLFMQVCQAVQHAHQKGIIHRDLKPSNILITMPDGAEPVPKVIDFGVAKAMENNLTDKTLFTRFEQMIGTPAYMSPEQAGAEGTHDIDTRADIYALGVLLYELLTGTTPFDSRTLQSAAFDEIRRILREDAVPRPSARLSSMAMERRTTIAKDRGTEAGPLGKFLRGDLDWIVMKAIEKDRRRRYDTANALALDVERHLANEPVTAGPPTVRYRFSKFLRRNKAGVGVAAVVLVSLVAGLALAAIGFAQARTEAKNARKAEALAEQRAQEAEAISSFLTRMFESSTPGEANGGPAITVVDSLKIAEKQLETDTEIPEQRRVILQSAIADVYANLSRETESLALREKVLQYFVENHQPEHPDRLSAMIKLAASRTNLGGAIEARPMADEALEGLRRVRGSEHKDTISAMRVLANIYSRLSGGKEKARLLNEELLTLYRKTWGPEHPHTLEMMLHASGSLRRIEECLALCRRVLGNEHPTTIWAMLEFARKVGSHLNRNSPRATNNEKALELYEEAMPLAVKVFGPEHRITLIAAGELAVYYHVNKRTEEAVAVAEENLSQWRKLWGLEHQDTLKAVSNLFNYYMAVDRAPEAMAMGEEALMTAMDTWDKRLPEIRLIAEQLEKAYRAAGQTSKRLVELGFGLPLHQESPAVVEVLVPPTSEWRWLHPVDGIDPGKADPDFHDSFFLAEFDDSDWAVGSDSSDLRGGFGYGDEDFTGVEIGTPTNKSLGTIVYFRHRFSTDKEFSMLELRYHRDDGTIIYLDGEEVARDNMPKGDEAGGGWALWSVGGENETAIFRLPFNEITLPPGEHVLTISLHNHGIQSSDLSIGAVTLVVVEPLPEPERELKITRDSWKQQWRSGGPWYQLWDFPAASANEEL